MYRSPATLVAGSDPVGPGWDLRFWVSQGDAEAADLWTTLRVKRIHKRLLVDKHVLGGPGEIARDGEKAAPQAPMVSDVSRDAASPGPVCWLGGAPLSFPV